MTYNVFGGTLNLALSIQGIRVRFLYEGHWVEVKVTAAIKHKIHYSCSVKFLSAITVVL